MEIARLLEQRGDVAAEIVIDTLTPGAVTTTSPTHARTNLLVLREILGQALAAHITTVVDRLDQ
jgi:thioesterase domain-containing protein